MANYNFDQITFIIPVRLDSLFRLENVLTVVRFFHRFHAHFIILEAGDYCSNILQKMLPKDKWTKYYFIQDQDIVFHRTHYINLMTSLAKTRYLAIWDSDVLVDPCQIQMSLNDLENGSCEVAYPYNGELMGVDPILRSLFIEHPAISFLRKNIRLMTFLYGPNVVGGGFVIRRDKYIESGGENEEFYGWGPEDYERFYRWKNYGYRVKNEEGVMYHLYHTRDLNGKYRSTLHQNLCQDALNTTCHSNKEQLRKQIKFKYSSDSERNRNL